MLSCHQHKQLYLYLHIYLYLYNLGNHFTALFSPITEYDDDKLVGKILKFYIPLTLFKITSRCFSFVFCSNNSANSAGTSSDELSLLFPSWSCLISCASNFISVSCNHTQINVFKKKMELNNRTLMYRHIGIMDVLTYFNSVKEFQKRVKQTTVHVQHPNL